jgi:hypothetical protein
MTVAVAACRLQATQQGVDTMALPKLNHLLTLLLTLVVQVVVMTVVCTLFMAIVYMGSTRLQFHEFMALIGYTALFFAVLNFALGIYARLSGTYEVKNHWGPKDEARLQSLLEAEANLSDEERNLPY